MTITTTTSSSNNKKTLTTKEEAEKKQRKQEKKDGRNRWLELPNDIWVLLLTTKGSLDPVTANVLASTNKETNATIESFTDHYARPSPIVLEEKEKKYEAEKKMRSMDEKFIRTVCDSMSKEFKLKHLDSLIKEGAKLGKSRFVSFFRDHLKIMGFSTCRVPVHSVPSTDGGGLLLVNEKKVLSKDTKSFSFFFSAAAKLQEAQIAQVHDRFSRWPRPFPGPSKLLQRRSKKKNDKEPKADAESREQKEMLMQRTEGEGNNKKRYYSGKILFPFPCWKGSDGCSSRRGDGFPNWAGEHPRGRKTEKGGSKNPIFCLSLLYDAVRKGRTQVFEWVVKLIRLFYADKAKKKCRTVYGGGSANAGTKGTNKMYLTDMDDFVKYLYMGGVVERLKAFALCHSFDFYENIVGKPFINVEYDPMILCDQAVMHGNADSIKRYMEVRGSKMLGPQYRKLNQRLQNLSITYKHPKDASVLYPVRGLLLLAEGAAPISASVVAEAVEHGNVEAALWCYSHNLVNKRQMWDEIAKELSDKRMSIESLKSNVKYITNSSDNFYVKQVAELVAHSKQLDTMVRAVESLFKKDFHLLTKDEPFVEADLVVDGSNEDLFTQYLKTGLPSGVVVFLEAGVLTPDPTKVGTWDHCTQQEYNPSGHSIMRGMTHKPNEYYSTIGPQIYSILLRKGLVKKENAMARAILKAWNELPKFMSNISTQMTWEFWNNLIDHNGVVQNKKGGRFFENRIVMDKVNLLIDGLTHPSSVEILDELAGEGVEFIEAQRAAWEFRICELKTRMKELMEELTMLNEDYGCFPDERCLCAAMLFNYPPLTELVTEKLMPSTVDWPNMATTVLSSAAYTRGCVEWLELLEKKECQCTYFTGFNMKTMGHAACMSFLMDRDPTRLLGTGISPVAVSHY